MSVLLLAESERRLRDVEDEELPGVGVKPKRWSRRAALDVASGSTPV